MKNPTNTNAADAKEIQTQLAGEKGGGRAYWNAVKKSKDNAEAAPHALAQTRLERLVRLHT